MQKTRGSITLFSLISILLITAAIFALLEGTRLQEMRRFGKLQTITALESTFSNYNTCLWQNYRLLGTERNAVSDILKHIANGKSGTGVNLFHMTYKKHDLGAYTLLTDAEGAVFVKCVSTYMKDNLVYEAAKEIYSQYESLKSILQANQMDVDNIEDALKDIEQVEAGVSQTSHGTSGKTVEELLREAKRWMEVGVLELFIEETESISEARLETGKGLLERRLHKGTQFVNEECSWVDRLLLQQYVTTYLSCYREEKENRALSYELEYLLGGSNSDVENLKISIAKLLAVREASNFLYLLSNADKMAQAEAMATVLAGVTLQPAIISGITLGILTAWALAESILDVRALLQGKRIALFKGEESWTSALENITSINKNSWTAKESKWGLLYEDYVGLLLLLEKEKTIAMRTMNVQEATIRKQYGDATFGMDTLMVQGTVEIQYSYLPVFPFLRVIDAEKRWDYVISASETYGYYER